MTVPLGLKSGWTHPPGGYATEAGYPKQTKVPILDPQNAEHPDFWLLSFKVWLPVLHDLFAAPEVQF